jgi:spore coat protein U-like protein
MRESPSYFRSGSVLLAHGLVACAFVAFALWAPRSPAATATGSLNVTGSITATCAVNASSLAFGAYNPTLNANSDVSGTVSVTCTNATPYNVGLNAGLGTGATVTARKMTSGANTLNYAIFRDAAHTLNWGNTVGTDTVTGTGNGAAQSITAYGRITSGQTTAAVGSYTDTVTITITY